MWPSLVSYYLYNYYILEYYYYYYSLLLKNIMEICSGDKIKSKGKQSSEEHIINHGVRGRALYHPNISRFRCIK